VEQERLFLVMLSVVYDRFRLINFYKNNVLMGTSTTAVTGDVELMLCGDTAGAVMTVRLQQANWGYVTGC
jgi:hypothetical protein